MQRYNIFFPIHRGLRALLFETGLQLQQTDFTNEDQTAKATADVRQVIAVFEGHADKEDHFVFAALAGFEPSVVNAFEQEHDEDHALGNNLQNWLTALSYAQATSARQLLGAELTKAFLDFATFNLKHMAKEEAVINPLLWRYYSDAELHAITKQILAGIAPAEQAIVTTWMVKGMNNSEIAGWLQGVKNGAPQPVFSAMLSLAEGALPAARWNSVREAIADGALLA